MLAAIWLVIYILWKATANSGGMMSYIITQLSMFTIFWSIFAAIYSLISVIQTLAGKPSPAWKIILLPTLGLWLFLCAHSYLFSLTFLRPQRISEKLTAFFNLIKQAV